MNVLVCGGAGFIGSHTMVELLNEGHNVICVDNFYNSSRVAIDRVEKITNKKIKMIEMDLLNINDLSNVFDNNKIDAVIMFAAYKAVGESAKKPLEYYYNNLVSVMNLLQVMRKHNVYNIIFSSSATVYGEVEKMPIDETFKANDLSKITNPYGRTKGCIENILMDTAKSNDKWKVVLLRYFNPVGAHKTGLLGEDPRGIPNNLMPYIAQVAIGKRDKLHIFGNDYETKDGTCIRDYIHVVDLAIGHVYALKCFEKNQNIYIYNLGTGKGYSVLEVVEAYEKASNKKINYVIDERRAGDIPMLYCDPKKVYEELGFKTKYDIYDMCKDSYNFQINNPDGYQNNNKVKMVFEDD